MQSKNDNTTANAKKEVDYAIANTQENTRDLSEGILAHRERLRAAMKILIRHISSDLSSFRNLEQGKEDDYTVPPGPSETSFSGSEQSTIEE
jgi:hypothetical protein